MKIKWTSLMVDDQENALRFYTEVLGFRKKHDVPVGEYRWITVTSPEGPDDVELALEPNANPAGKAFQAAMFGFRIGEISCPTRYFAEASSINFRRSVVYGMGVLSTSLKYRLHKSKLKRNPLFDPDGKKLIG